jgi:hypothetical protein
MNDDELWSHTSVLIDKWFGSDIWSIIVEQANDGDEESMQLMERVSDQLCSLIFYIRNNSHERVRYEMDFFSDLIEEYKIK